MRPFVYDCPACGTRFAGPSATHGPEARAVEAHVRRGFAACRVPLETPTPPGFTWECAGDGFTTTSLRDAQLHTLQAH